MAYNTAELYEKAKEAIVKDKLHFIADVIAILPCSKATFYDHFPDKSDQLDELKTLITSNQVDVKKQLRKKWLISDNATLQMALYKLLADDGERKSLSQTYIDHSTQGKEINTVPKITPDQLDKLIDKL